VQWDLREEYRSRCHGFAATTGWQTLLKARLKRERDAAGGCAAAPGIPATPALIIVGGLIGVLGARRRRQTTVHPGARHCAGEQAEP